MGKYCIHCGREVNETGRFCANCGQPINSGVSSQENNDVQQQYQQEYNVYNVPQQYQQDGAAQMNREHVQPVVLPMKWYKFVIWVQLFLNALSMLGSGVLTITGLQYGESREWVYYFYGGMRVLDVIVGLIAGVLCVGAIYVRQQLAKFKRNATKLYIYYLIAVLSLQVLYILLTSLIIGSLALTASDAGGIIGSAVLIMCNYVYFMKRQHLFVN